MSVWREPLYWGGLIAATVFWCAVSLLALLVGWWHERRKARRPRRAAPTVRQVRREQLRELFDDTVEQERIR